VSDLHFRSTVRTAVVALLAGAGTAAGARVFDTPTDPRATFPALVVEDVGEQQQRLSGRGSSATVRRTLLLEVTAEVQQNTGYARMRDELIAQVETALAAASIPGVQDLVPAGYAPDAVLGGERPIALGRQRFALTYITPQGAPAAPFA
jgi:hypothetical protein